MDVAQSCWHRGATYGICIMVSEIIFVTCLEHSYQNNAMAWEDLGGPTGPAPPPLFTCKTF